MGIYSTNCQKYDEDADTLPINKLIEADKKVLREFIAGLLIVTDDAEISEQGEKFIPNNRFIGMLPQEEKDAFFESIKDKLIGYGLKKVNDTTPDYSSLDSYFGISTYYDDQLNKYQNKTGKAK